MNVQQLLTNAIYKSVQDRAFQRIILPHYKLVALNELNYVLDEWRDLIPFESKIVFNNVDNMTNSRFVEVDSVSYVINQTSTVLVPLNYKSFREQKSVQNLQGYPQIYYFDQLNQTIEIYPAPSNPTYQFIVEGRIQTANVGEFDELPAQMPSFMISAVTWEVAFRICAEFGVPWDAKKEQIREKTVAGLLNKKNIDLTPKPDCVFGLPDAGSSAPFPFWSAMSGGIV